ncbi:unnamed protein product [Polarella glacialis]|uniref:Peptidyl-prolyl cis-trans isomerase n=1 Tax=Polarella glacialis TaxID=89957 RepID=A0A813KEQ9_POLGL|nr:unnamed protein product [Polarella glacialis]CAE8705128.1 unnamed protein product [Polarella glacialis]
MADVVVDEFIEDTMMYAPSDPRIHEVTIREGVRQAKKTDQILKQVFFQLGTAKFTGGHIFILLITLFIIGVTIFSVRYNQSQGGKSVSARHIVMRSEAELVLARKRIEGGESFAKVAKALSCCPTSASMGGELGCISPGTLDLAMERVLFNPNVRVGQVVGPVRTRHGYHLFKIEWRSGVDDDEDRKNQ